MNKRDFDENVRKLLSDFEASYDPTSWDAFEEKLNFEEEMDALIKESMENHKEPFQEEHWELLTEEINRRKIRTLVKRTTEVAILLLLVFTTQNIVQYKGSAVDNSREKFFVSELETNEPQLKFQNPSVLFDFEITNKAIPGNHSLQSLTSLQNNTIPDGIESMQIALIPQREKDVVLKPLGKKQLNAFGLRENVPTLANWVESNHDIVSLTSLPKSQIQEFAIYNSNTKSIAHDDIVTIRDQEGIWLSLITTADVNFINSPLDLNLVRNPIQSQSGSIGLGLGISKDFGNLEVQSGLIYSRKKYSPSRIRQFVPAVDQKLLETSLKNMNFEQVQIPILANFHSPRVLGVSVYATVGVGVNVITSSFYNVRTQVRSFSGQNLSSQFKELDLRDLPKGIFNGGSFDHNVYASGIIGFGIEKRFNSMYAFNIGSSYQRSITSEINPIINRTQQLGLSAALKVNLK